MGVKDYKHISTSETPFLLAYRTEVIIHVNICMPTLHTGEIDRDQNAIQLHLAQDQSGERRLKAQIRIAAYQQQIKAAHHKKVKTNEFQDMGLVLKRVIQCTKERNVGKLEPNWKGMDDQDGNGSYTLDDQDGKALEKQWNSSHLKQYYV